MIDTTLDVVAYLCSVKSKVWLRLAPKNNPKINTYVKTKIKRHC